jgi:hypothetical protein
MRLLLHLKKLLNIILLYFFGASVDGRNADNDTFAVSTRYTQVGCFMMKSFLSPAVGDCTISEFSSLSLLSRESSRVVVVDFFPSTSTSNADNYGFDGNYHFYLLYIP